MNLATARGINRAVEVGIRKAAGAQRSELILQFIGESILLCLLATFVAVALVDLFAISALLITATAIVYNQVEYMQTKKLGFNKERLLILPIQTSSLREQYETFKNEVKQHPNILAVSASANMPGGSDYGIPSIPEGLSEDDPWDARHLVVDHDFLATYDVQILQGRNFSKDISSDAGAYIINEAAAKKLGCENPLTKTIAMPVIGHFSSSLAS